MERGTHEELIEAKGLYSELYKTQFLPGAHFAAATGYGPMSDTEPDDVKE